MAIDKKRLEEIFAKDHRKISYADIRGLFGGFDDVERIKTGNGTIEELRILCSIATPGVWEAHFRDGLYITTSLENNGFIGSPEYGNEMYLMKNAADSTLLMAAVNTLPKLLALLGDADEAK